MVGLFIDKLVDPLLIVATPLWLHDNMHEWWCWTIPAWVQASNATL